MRTEGGVCLYVCVCVCVSGEGGGVWPTVYAMRRGKGVMGIKYI